MIRRRAALLLALLLLMLLAPSVSADHTYSHRYVVFGKVVDAQGAPVANATVQMRPTFPTEGACASNLGAATDAWGADAMRVTNERGEFWLCAHAHAMSGNLSRSIELIATDLEGMEIATESVAADPDLRASYVTLVAAGAQGGDAPEDHLVVGRVWSPWVPGEPLDGVAVNGLARTRQLVTIVLEGDDGLRREATTSTNSYGDFAVRLAASIEGGTVTVRAAGAEVSTEAGAHGWTNVTVIAGPAGEAILLGSGTDWTAPGSETPNPRLRVLPGANVTMLSVALDESRHKLVVDGLSTAAPVSGRGAIAYANFTAPARGPLAYWCEFHRAQGMEGVIEIVGTAAVPTPTEPGTPPTPTHADRATTAAPTENPIVETPSPGALVVVALALVALAFGRRPYP